MYDFNFYIQEDFKDTIFEFVKESKSIELEKKDDMMVTAIIKKGTLSREIYEIYKDVFDRGDVYKAIYLISMCDAIRNGPKVIVPTVQECQALMNTKINLPYSEYRQPYQTVFIEFPEAFIKEIAQLTKMSTPKACIAYCNYENQFSFYSYIHKAKDYHSTHCYLNMVDKEKSIEDILENSIPARANKTINKDEINIMTIFQRIVLNINLIMVSRGLKSHGFMNHKYKIHKARQNVKDLEILGFAQKIFKTQSHKSNAPTGSHDSPHPHWRSGHNRHQHYGPKNSLTKIIFIEPVWVGAEQDLSKTSVEYHNII